MDRGELNLHHWSKVGKEYICNRNEIQLSDLHGKQLHVDNLKKQKYISMDDENITFA